MKEYQLVNDEVILYEGLVKFGVTNRNVKLALTSQNMLFEKEKGIFKKKMCVMENIPINKIKIYKGKVQIKQKKSTLIIQTVDKNIEFTLDNILEAKQVVEKIINVRTDTNFWDRTIVITDNLTKIIKSFIGLTTAIVAAPAAVKELNKRKGEIAKAFKNFIKIVIPK